MRNRIRERRMMTFVPAPLRKAAEIALAGAVYAAALARGGSLWISNRAEGQQLVSLRG
jgi:hypothetical protein